MGRSRTLSIALRMTMWYALSTFALILIATGFLYWVLTSSLEAEDARILEDNLHNLRLLVKSQPPSVLTERGGANAALAGEPQPYVYFRILDAGTNAIVETPGISSELPVPDASELAELSSGREVGRKVTSHSGRILHTLSAREGGAAGAGSYVVQVALDRKNEETLLARYRERLVLALSISLVLCSFIGYAIARSGMRPIERIARTAERIGSSTLHTRIATLGGLPPELEALAKTFNGMLDRLQDSFSRVSRFSNDVAHELRTPINNLRGEIEVALSKARSNEEYRETLGSCLEECERISRVIHSLLFLARAQTGLEPSEREAVDIGKELEAVGEFYEAAASEAGIALDVSAAPGLRAAVDRTLFRQAVWNLVSNSIAHTPKGGSTDITAAGDSEWLRVTVTDTGRGIAAEHLPYVLDRFYRADSARSSLHGSLGLGLAVVKSIMDRHRGHIEIDSEVGRGTRVDLMFPL